MIAGYKFEYTTNAEVSPPSLLKSLKSWRDEVNATYSYDSKYQLTSATYAVASTDSNVPIALPANESFNLDATGNRKTPQNDLIIDNRVPRMVTDASGNPSLLGSEAVDEIFGYTGREWDADADLQYNRARWYDPRQGRFISQDPIGFAGGDANLYRYVGNGPTNATDPSGLYNEGGHFFTVYIVAVAAGKSKAEAFRLAYYSQLPDQVKFMEAISVYQNESGAWSKQVYNCLHSLHGGDRAKSLERREQLHDYLKQNYQRLNVWQKGIMLHALGDAFAHTDANDDAWKWRLGHGLHGHLPDYISHDPEKFGKYVRTLYSALNGPLTRGEIEENYQMMDFLEFVKTLPPGARLSEGPAQLERFSMFMYARKKHDYNSVSVGCSEMYIPNWQFNAIDELYTPTMSEVEAFMNHMVQRVIGK
jgi:RHS repeat-associated protein